MGMTTNEAIEWIQEEKASFERAPYINDCAMTEDWKRAIDVYEMAISAIRQQDQSPDSEKMMQREPITNADRLNAMTIEGKAEFISSIAYVRETPWSEPFSRRMCDSCPTVHGTYEGGIEDDFHECDFVDGKCPHGSAIVWWLKQPAEEDDHGHES